MVGVCMGAAYLAEAGLLDGRMATTHWGLSDKFAARYPQVDWRPDLFITEDSRVLCSGGVFASIDVSLYLVEKLCGHDVAVKCAKSMLLPMPRIHQTGYAMQTVSQAHGDDRIRDVEAFLQANFHTDISTQALAERAGLGERTFVRHFKAATGKLPAGYIQALRIQAAKAMLEHDAKPVQAISSDVGYDDVAFFRHIFQTHRQDDPHRIPRPLRALERAGRDGAGSLAAELILAAPRLAWPKAPGPTLRSAQPWRPHSMTSPW